MNGRKILIQYKNRPDGETDMEREEIFEEYWQAFTQSDKTPKIEGCIGFLMTSLDYFNKQGKKFIWKDVELYNGDEALDDFQVALINLLREMNFVQKTGNYHLNELYDATYGKNNTQAGKALTTIGVKRLRKKLGGELVSGYVIGNPKRFKTFIVEEKEKESKVDLSIF